MGPLKKKIVPKPTEVTVAEQVQEALKDTPHMGAVLLIPDGDRGLKVLVRGTGGAWWEHRYNEEGKTVHLPHLGDVEQAVLIPRDMVDALLEGEVTFHDHT